MILIISYYSIYIVINIMNFKAIYGFRKYNKMTTVTPIVAVVGVAPNYKKQPKLYSYNCELQIHPVDCGPCYGGLRYRGQGYGGYIKG